MEIKRDRIFLLFTIFGLIIDINATTSTESMTTSTESITTTESSATIFSTTTEFITTQTDNALNTTTTNNDGTTTIINTDSTTTMSTQNYTSTTESTTTGVTSIATMAVTGSPTSSTMTSQSPTNTSQTSKILTSTMPTTITTLTTTTMTPTTTSTTTIPTTTMTTTPCPTVAAAGTGSQDSDFGKVGFVAFGITFAIALILFVILLIILIRRKRKSGEYVTGEGTSPRLMMDGLHMSVPMNNDLEHADTIDLDKADERKVGNGTGLSSFKTEEVPKTFPTEGTASSLKREDNGSINNLLHVEDSDKKDFKDKEDSDDDMESPATFVGLKIEPSSGVSVESLRQMNETDKLMDNTSEGTPSIDDNLPPPSLSESESESSKGNVAKNNNVTEV